MINILYPLKDREKGKGKECGMRKVEKGVKEGWM
jgi:hypothetical protein